VTPKLGEKQCASCLPRQTKRFRREFLIILISVGSTFGACFGCETLLQTNHTDQSVTANVFQPFACAKIRLQRPQEIKQIKRTHTSQKATSLFGLPKTFHRARHQHYIDEHSFSVHSRSGTMISDFTPTMDSSGMWDSTCSSWRSSWCSSWRSRCCSGRASHPMRVKSGYSAGKKVNIVELEVTAR